MRKLVVLMMVLAMASLAVATPTIQLGNASGVFGAGNTNITVTAGSNYDVYVYASSDAALGYYPDGTLDDQGNDISGTVIPTTGLDNFQMFLQYNQALVDLPGSLNTYTTAVSGNPFGTVWSGKATNNYGGMRYVEGALLPASNVDAFALTKVAKITFKVSAYGAVVALVPNASLTHQSKVGNSAAGLDIFAGSGVAQQSVTFTPEPATLAILGLGALMLRRKKA